MRLRFDWRIKESFLSICLLCIVVALFITWPLALNMGGFVLPQIYPDIKHSDSLQHMGVIHEVKRLIDNGESPVVADKRDVSQSYIFLGVLLTEYLGMEDVVFHNLFFLSSLVLAGVFMYLLMLELSKDRLAAVLAGFIYMSSCYIPYAYYWGHSNTMQIQWIPLVFYFFERIIKDGRLKDGLFLGVAMAMQVFGSTYHVVHLSFMLPFYFIVRGSILGWKPAISMERIAALGASVISCILLSSFYLLKKLKSEAIIRTLSENLNPLWRLDYAGELFGIEAHLYIGLMQVLLFCLGVIMIVKNFRQTEYKVFGVYGIIGLFVLICLIGPVSVIAPYYWLFRFWPFFDHLRVAFRMYPFFLMGVSVVASAVLVYMKSKPAFKRYRIYAAAFFILVMVVQILLSPWLANLHVYFV
ncbi:hypothetical protein KY320_03260 [Candidatus Woesearchaeota archaeon]|nr:hypothetical protein [Candidatus Woesearchaeota archaeon]